MTEDKLPLTSQDVLGDKISALQELFPEVFTEGKVDFERLKLALGESIDEGRERYGLSWAGKSEAIRNLQAQSVGTLTPIPEESVNFETTENIFIEGDNLEVLKLLQKSYHNRIKMIYIDPPYNTGNEFIYPDNFREGLEDYLRYSGQKNGEGIKLTTNTETNGRFHSKWLNMMYPRLFLARTLLRDDGVIFVSIDDHEVHNLRALMNEIFGEETFIGQLTWKSRQNVDNRTTTGLSADHEYVLCYGKKIRGKERREEQYSNPDNDPRGDWASGNMVGLKPEDLRPNLHYDLINPATGINYGKPKLGWRYDKNTMGRLISEDRIIWPASPDGRPRKKVFLSELQASTTGFSSVIGKNIYTKHGTAEIDSLFESKVFDFAKPSSLIRELLIQGSESSELNDIILDFFVGSGTTAHAILKLNEEDDGNRTFIVVQLPEACDENSEVFKSGYKTIADISKERIRRVITKINEEKNGTLNLNGSSQQDRGFKVFKLTESNFKIWDGTAPQNVEQLSILLQEFAENIRPGTTKLGMLYEILLKAGFPLTVKIEKLDIAGQDIYATEDQELFICLEPEILEDTVRQILTYQPKPKQFISLDSSFRGNDQLKTNTQLQMRDHDIKFRTV
ncbi:MAG: site-specific DNA-methyltransferase [Cyanobacteriota bacterium]|jgi:adenine-specific DNA-methyltransferase